MENLNLKIAFRRDKQKREWPTHLKRVAQIFGSNTDVIQLLEAGESLQFERELFAKSRKGFADGTVHRVTEVPEAQLATVISDCLPLLTIDPIVIALVNLMDFTFLTTKMPTPAQLLQFVKIDGDSVFVTSRDLTHGMCVDMYKSEKGDYLCFEVDVW